MGILPIGLAAVVLFLFYSHFAPWLTAVFGLPQDHPFQDDLKSYAWMALILVAFAASLFLGYALGWMMNAVTAFMIFAWSSEKISAVFLRSEIPHGWFKQQSEESTDNSILYRLGAVFLAAIGILLLYLGISGVLAGEIEACGRRSHHCHINYLASDPFHFWWAIVFFIAGGIFMLFLAYKYWNK